ncbi:hypothetical protein NPS01_41870 [Nocardioides psychrotolerans]|uniref:DUF3626 domain-containing protein n=1 Tax=Nocardioides psychrotolerans TaxID=1005945 RepID=A0A1I3RKC1_9ACTN|nr:DUF3626 domain-containing protein [Nocardioides psychrotolerans]GEP40524.1 hypothetical protein NPS01_41870 [Nocardioides psychrotolerans]SFJ45606.1 Protein of unknown function [Nocardioides psychrotolerans]
MSAEPSPWARAAIGHVSRRATGGPLDRSLRITFNFHPDRVRAGGGGGPTVLQELAVAGTYRSQFETGTSNGGLTAHPTGDRWRWESRIFAGAYDDAPPAQRPRYGALDHRRRALGGAPRFGSCHLRLAEHVLDRSTFCFPDSVFEPTDLATADRCDLVRLAEAAGADVLDDYVEAHVHGAVDLSTDVEALVLDPSFRHTPIDDHASRLGVPVEWHEGRRLDVPTLERHPGFRGPEIVEVGRSVAEDGVLDAAVIGRALLLDRHDPQDLKKVWHHVARFGSPWHC